METDRPVGADSEAVGVIDRSGGARDGMYDPVIHELVLALTRPGSFGESGEGASHTAQELMHALLAHLERTHGGLPAEPSAPSECLAPWQVRRATELMWQRMSEKICLPEVAESCGLSTSYFSRLFKNTLGMTAHQWLTMQRIERVKELLSMTRMPIVEIAFATGFADQTHMTRVFSKRVNASPMVWRRRAVCLKDETAKSLSRPR